MIAAIPTTYRGIRMRSRLEAKWASIFDALGWEWEYEPIDLNGWIPDFVFPNHPFFKRPLLAEIKPIFAKDTAVINKIEDAMNAPPRAEQRALGRPEGAWDKWHAERPYDLAIFGAAPSAHWYLLDGGGWWGFGELYEETEVNFRPHWTKATNASQWRPA